MSIGLPCSPRSVDVGAEIRPAAGKSPRGNSPSSYRTGRSNKSQVAFNDSIVLPESRKRPSSAPCTRRMPANVPDIFSDHAVANIKNATFLTPRAKRAAMMNSPRNVVSTGQSEQAAPLSQAGPLRTTPRQTGLVASLQARAASAERFCSVRRRCSTDSRDFRGQAHYSPGIWRDLPVYTPMGKLDSLQQPSVSLSSAAARATVPLSTEGDVSTKALRLRTDPKPLEPAPFGLGSGNIPAATREDPPPNSARDFYLKGFSSGVAPFASEGSTGAISATTPLKTLRAMSRPRGSGGLSQSQIKLGLGLARSDAGSIIRSKSAACPAEKAGEGNASDHDQFKQAAGSYYAAGPMAGAIEAAAVEAAGVSKPLEPLQVASRPGHPFIHPDNEKPSVPVRRFEPPSRTLAVALSHSGRPMSTSYGSGSAWELASFNGRFGSLELSGWRRERAASSGVMRARQVERNKWRS